MRSEPEKFINGSAWPACETGQSLPPYFMKQRSIRGLNIHGQRALSFLGVTPHAICRSTRLTPCLGGSSWGSAIPLPLGHSGCREEPSVEEEEGALPKEQSHWSTGGALELSKGSCGKGGLADSIVCAARATFMETRQERQATPPEPAEPSVHSPVCSLFQT